MNNYKFAFVDIETTGLSPIYNQIIDIGVVVYQNNKIIQTWQSLINPKTYISPFISKYTGIKQSDLIKAPSFEQISGRFMQLMQDSIFVAHNVQFDYNFIKNEYAKIEEEFEMPNLCTVALSRKLFPKYKKHNLDTIIKRMKINCKNRHRALPDAIATSKFFIKTQELFDNGSFKREVLSLIKQN